MSGSSPQADVRASRLPRKLLLFFLGFCAVPLCVLAAVSYLMAANAVEQMLGRELERELSDLRVGLVRLQDHIRTSVAQLAADGFRAGSALRRGLTGEPVGDGELTAPLSFIEQRALFSSFVVIDAAGTPRIRLYAPGFKEAERYFTMTRVERRRFAPEDTLGFGRAIRQPRGWCTVERRPSGLPILRALVPIHLDEEAAPRGVLAADVPLADLLAQAARSGAVPAFDPSSSIVRFAVDRDSGVFLFHDDVSQLHRPVSVSERDLGTRLAALELLDATRVQAESSARRGRYRAADGGEWQVMALADARLGVVVGASAAYERLLVPFRNAAALVALATLGLIALSGVLILVFSRSFRRSLRDLLGASTAYARGMFSHRVPVRPQDDLAPLALQLNAMAGDLERLIVEREEAARFESVSRVASLVAHDLKGLVFSLSLLADNLAAGAPDERSRRRAVGSLEALVRKMKKTVTQLPQAGRTREVDRRRLDLAALVRDTVAELGVETMESVDVQTRLDRPAWIGGDADALRRVVSNLLWNALEAMPGGGRLQVQVRERSGSVWLSVSDTGRGMSEQFVRASLFKPFHTTKERGLGLGMVAVRDGVEAHGGRIEVESAEGRGTTFTLRFPAARPLEADSATSPRMRGASAQAVPRTLRSGAEPRTDQEKSS